MLSENEQRNIKYYVDDKIGRGERIPEVVWILPTVWGGPAPLLSLVLEDGPCGGLCRGIAVLPSKNKIQLIPFSYRKYYVLNLGAWRWTHIDGFDEMPSMFIAFLDPDEREVIDFFDVWRMQRGVPEGSRDIALAEANRSEARTGNILPRIFDYSACFDGRLGTVRDIPLLEVTPAMPRQ